MRQGWRPYPRLSSDTGKRRTGRGRSRRHPDPATVRVTYQPRPHISIRIRHRAMRALIDTGSEVSFINTDTAQYAESLGFVTH